jgi:demethylmenaquinone methyltransferase/2-methoxy-6-polyprenyl-1,4-benzoquinol methylase
MHRVLCKRIGRIFILEFSQPKGIFKRFYAIYLRHIVPWLAQLITGNRSAYEYLGSSIEQFPEKEILAQELKLAGFKQVRHYGLTAGVVTIHEAQVFEK